MCRSHQKREQLEAFFAAFSGRMKATSDGGPLVDMRDARVQSFLATLDEHEGHRSARAMLQALLVDNGATITGTGTDTSSSHAAVAGTEEADLASVWSQLPLGLDPAAGDLKPFRAARKRQQVLSVCRHSIRLLLALALLPPADPNAVKADKPFHIVEFGAGSGHVGLLLAHLCRCLPGAWHVTLLDRKGFGITQMEARISDAGLADVASCIEGDCTDFIGRPFDFGVSLHSCGLLTDLAMQACVKASAAFVLCPCCYGQL